MKKRLDQDAKRMRRLISERISWADDGKAIRIASYKANAARVGKDLAAIAKEEARSATDIAIQILKNGGARVVKFAICEQDVRHVMAIDWVATASDGGAKLPGATKPHPRNYGTFPRKLAFYSIKEKVIPLERAVYSMTGLPKQILSMTDRGLVQNGLVADITVFNPETLRDTATFDEPHQYAEGIEYVFVNGKPALVEGMCTGMLAGRALRKSTQPPSMPPSRPHRSLPSE